MYRFAYKYNDEIIFYYDLAGNKYVASGGNLAWRINNPGLIHSYSHFSRACGSIGSSGHYAIFSTPQEGRQALISWIHSKKYFESTLEVLGKQYLADNPEAFVLQVSAQAKISSGSKISSLSKQEFDRLINGIEKFCAYTLVGNENHSLLPKIIAKIEMGRGQEDNYLIGDRTVLSKEEAIKWILSHRLDGVIVQERSGGIHLRSRPNHCVWSVKMHADGIPPAEGLIDTLVRLVGESKPRQCVWGFINGIKNSKEEALESATLISRAADGERVFSMPNDSMLWGIKDILACFALKVTIDTPIVAWAVKFLRYLLAVANQEGSSSVIVFVHSQGALITEHALELLSQGERNKLRIFTFGGASFLLPGKSHADTHNYASAADFVCQIGSPNHQSLALERYYGRKNGLSDDQLIAQLALQDAMLYLDSFNINVMDTFVKQRKKHYDDEFSKISNLTVLDPDPDSRWKHRFDSECYQAMVKTIVKRYQR